LNVAHAGDSLTVPTQAVDQTGTPYVLLVNTANRVEKRPVRTGISTSTQVEILSGLSQGDRVIALNLASYQPGEVVTPRQTTSPGQEAQ